MVHYLRIQDNVALTCSKDTDEGREKRDLVQTELTVTILEIDSPGDKVVIFWD